MLMQFIPNIRKLRRDLLIKNRLLKPTRYF
jgi:hypothetical protein